MRGGLVRDAAWAVEEADLEDEAVYFAHDQAETTRGVVVSRLSEDAPPIAVIFGDQVILIAGLFVAPFCPQQHVAEAERHRVGD